MEVIFIQWAHNDGVIGTHRCVHVWGFCGVGPKWMAPCENIGMKGS